MLSSRYLIAAFSVVLFACSQEAPPTPKSEALTAREVAKAPTPAPSSEAVPEAFVTHKKADPERMPHDGIHAPLRTGGTQQRLPAGHPPIAGHAPHSPRPMRGPGMVPRGGAAEKGVERPLPLKGPGSAAELANRRKLVASAEGAEALERDIEALYRFSFTVDRGKRDHAKAHALCERLSAHPTAAATAERVRGFLAVTAKFDTKAARKHYEKAIELDPDFGEAHYALAFLCALNDRAAGQAHYVKAVAAGVEDTMSLDRLYGSKNPHLPPGH